MFTTNKESDTRNVSKTSIMNENEFILSLDQHRRKKTAFFETSLKKSDSKKSDTDSMPSDLNERTEIEKVCMKQEAVPAHFERDSFRLD